MSLTGDVVIYQMNLDEVSTAEFKQEVFEILNSSADYENVRIPNIAFKPFYDLEADHIVEANLVSVGFHLKKVPVLTSDMIQRAFNLWSQIAEKKEKLIIVSLGSISPEVRELANGYHIDIWGTFTLYARKYPNRRRRQVAAKSKEETLASALFNLGTGKAEWATYQQLSCDIFEFLFVPPLEPPRFENADNDKRNRRDMIFENSNDHAYWKMLRQKYKADYIVIDAKNYSEPIGKQPILDITHYLKPCGCGLFGVILTRKGADQAAAHAIKEQRISANKLILVLDDRDLLTMLEMKRTGKRPEEVIRVKIADFRMSL